MSEERVKQTTVTAFIRDEKLAFKTPIEVPGSLLIGINARPLQWVLTAEAALPMREHYTKMNAKISS